MAKHINISIPGNATVNKLTLNLDEVRKMLESGQKFDKIKDITTFFGKSFATQAYSYDFAIYKAKVNVVVSVSDGDRILLANESSGFLERCAVVLVK